MTIRALIAVLFFAVCALSAPARAALTITFDTCVSGQCGSAGSAATLTIAETAPNTITFTFVNTVAALSNDTASAHITKLLFSYSNSPAISADDFVKTNFAAVGGAGNGDFDLNPSTFSGYEFFVELDLPTSNSGGGTKRFKDGEVLTWTLTETGLSESDFTQLVEGHGPDAIALVYVKGLSGDGNARYAGNADAADSPAVSEPGTLAVLAASLLGFALLRASQRRQAATFASVRH